jgi:hypothetical protein
MYIIFHGVTAEQVQIVGFWLMTRSSCFGKIGKAVKLLYFNNMPSKINVDRGSSNCIWQRATPISVDWFAGRKLKK